MRFLALTVALLATFGIAEAQTVKVFARRVQGPVCGDGVKNGTDACDGTDFGTDTCAAHGCTGGSLTCSSDCATISIGSCTGCPVIPNLLVETFAGAQDPHAGYDNPTGSVSASWSEGGAVDPNEVAGCGTGTGWSGDCLKLNIPNFTTTRARIDLPAPHAKVCSRVRVKWQSATSWGASSHDQLFGVGSTSADSEFCDPYCVEGVLDAGTDFRLKLALNPGSRGAVTQGGASDLYPPSGPGLTLPWSGRVEVCFTNSGVGDSWEWRVDGVVQGAGTGDISIIDGQRMILGVDSTGSYAPNAALFYLDACALSDEGFVGDN